MAGVGEDGADLVVERDRAPTALLSWSLTEGARKGCYAVAIVWQTPLGVESYAAAGHELEVPRFGCPACGQPMSFWGWSERDLRAARSFKLIVRRQRCKACRTSHSVLPSFVTHGRLDAVGVIGAALEVMTGPTGSGARKVAQALDLPPTTVRDWRRRFVSRAEVLAAGASRAVVALGGVAPSRAKTPGAVAIGALRAAWREALRRFGQVVGSLWRFANCLVGSHLLSTNINPPWSTA